MAAMKVVDTAEATAADSSARVRLSPNVSYVLIGGLVASIFSGGAYFATQTVTNAAAFAAQGVVNNQTAEHFNRIETGSAQRYAGLLARLDTAERRDAEFAQRDAVVAATLERLNRSEVAFLARLDAMDKRDDARLDLISKIDTRLTRIEAQLTFLVSGAKK